ncbi:MAG: hypothetical protein Ct9H300mP14_01110 [Gammaproteobacteria bacterium]|nr:MAG: hypothetical protein Ct9H300mP14_01110 [Gammaproteobacteria bacterium]
MMSMKEPVWFSGVALTLCGKGNDADQCFNQIFDTELNPWSSTHWGGLLRPNLAIYRPEVNQ